MADLHDALDNCLQAMAHGATIDVALKRYPKLARDLRPLLEASILAREASRVHVPLDVRRRGRSRLLGQVEEYRGARARSRGRAISFFPRLAITAGMLGVLVLTSTGLVSAASTSLPGQQLYPVKRTWESVRLLFAFTPQERDLMESGYEQERLDEIHELLGQRQSASISFSGLLARQTAGQWTVSGIPVLVGPSTRLPTAAVSDGAPVTVMGVTRPDGVVEAREVQLLAPGVSLPPLEPSEVNEQEHHDDEGNATVPTPGVTAQPQATQASSGDQHAIYNFSGVVQAMQGNLWRINGQSVYVDTAQISGQIQVGSIVTLQGYYTTDGRFIVTTIEPQTGGSTDVHKGDGSGKSSGSEGSGDSGGSEESGGSGGSE
ncbi:MAG: DUF5666 domain-containing protein, partial [Anaerolineae bacterium]